MNIPVKTYLYKEVCAHDAANLTFYEAKASTCSTHGNMEYYYCSNCCGYLKADKTTEIKLADTVLPLAAHTNTTFVPATEPTCQAHGNIDYTYCADCGGYYYDLGKELAAKSITPEADGSIKFNKARNKDAIVMKLDFACECSDLDQGTVRYALRTTAGNKVLNLESYGGFCLTYYAKYGWRIALNDDGSAKMSDVYEENLEDWNAGSGKLCVYKHWDNDYNASVFFSSSDKEAHTTENTYSLTKWPVYLYRLTETGTINGGLHTYTLNDAKSNVSQSIEVPSASAAAISNISGVSQALTKDSINGFVTKRRPTEKACA